MDPNQDTRLSVLESQVTTITNSVGKLETKIEKYEKRDNDSQSGDVCTADHR